MNGDLSLDWLTGRDVAAIPLEKLIGQHMGAEVRRRAESGEYDIADVKPDLRPEVDGEWEADGKLILRRATDAECQLVARVIEYTARRSRLQQMAATLREELEKVARHFPNEGPASAVTSSFDLMTQALRRIIAIAHAIPEPDAAGVKIPTVFHFGTPRAVGSPSGAMRAHRRLLSREFGQVFADEGPPTGAER